MLTSVAHEWGHKWLDMDDLHFKHRKYHDMGAYAQSKLANLLFAKQLAVRCAAKLWPALQCEEDAQLLTGIWRRVMRHPCVFAG